MHFDYPLLRYPFLVSYAFVIGNHAAFAQKQPFADVLQNKYVLLKLSQYS